MQGDSWTVGIHVRTSASKHAASRTIRADFWQSPSPKAPSRLAASWSRPETMEHPILPAEETSSGKSPLEQEANLLIFAILCISLRNSLHLSMAVLSRFGGKMEQFNCRTSCKMKHSKSCSGCHMPFPIVAMIKMPQVTSKSSNPFTFAGNAVLVLPDRLCGPGLLQGQTVHAPKTPVMLVSHSQFPRSTTESMWVSFKSKSVRTRDRL